MKRWLLKPTIMKRRKSGAAGARRKDEVAGITIAQIAYLGEEYVSLAFKRFYQDRIDEEELADYLNVKPKQTLT